MIQATRPKPMHAEAPREYRIRCILWMLQQTGPIRMDDLVDSYRNEFRTKVVKETVGRALYVLEKRGYAERWIDESDGRAVLWRAAA